MGYFLQLPNKLTIRLRASNYHRGTRKVPFLMISPSEMQKQHILHQLKRHACRRLSVMENRSVTHTKDLWCPDFYFEIRLNGGGKSMLLGYRQC